MRHDFESESMPWPAMVASAGALLLAALGSSSVTLLLPTLAETMAKPDSWVQWLVTGYLLTMSAAAMVIGTLADCWGRMRLLRACLLGFLAAALMAAVSEGFTALLLSRLIQGCAAGGMMVLPLALARDVTPAAGLGRVMGLLGAVSALGTVSGPLLAGLLLDSMSWTTVFWVQGLSGLGLLALSSLAVTDQGHGKAVTLDVAGLLVLMLMLGCLASLPAVVGAGVPAWTVAVSLLALAAGGVLYWIETHLADPLLDLALIAEPSLAASLFSNLMVAAVVMSTLIIGPLLLSETFDLRASALGLMLALGPLTSFLSATPAGWLTDRLGVVPARLLGLITVIAGIGLLARLTPLIGLIAYALGIVVLTPGYQLFQASNQSLTLLRCDNQRRGEVSGLLSLSRNIGLICGSAGLGGLFVTLPGEMLWRYSVTYAVAGCGLLLALWWISRQRIALAVAAQA